jgi:phosphoribosylglycinamide formyltransferase-1
LTKQIAIFASGAGSNAKKIIEHFSSSTKINIALIVCNKPTAGVCSIAKENNIPLLLIEKKKFQEDGYVAELNSHKIDWIVLAGFLWKVPAVLINAYPGRMINIHPALLPNYGGKGMYGNNVHEAVIAAGETKSGITIHLVDEHYDHGKILFQATCEISKGDTATTLAAKIHQLEHQHFSAQIEKLLSE